MDENLSPSFATQQIVQPAGQIEAITQPIGIALLTGVLGIVVTVGAVYAASYYAARGTR